MDSNAEQLFRKLLEPISVIGDLFQVNLSTILDPFLNHLEDVLCKVKDARGNGEKDIDFVRAGYLITNATLLYSAKVDSLYKDVHDFIDKLRSDETNDNGNDENVDPEEDLELKLNNSKNPFCLLPISGLKKGSNSSRFCEHDPHSVDVFAKTQVSFMPMSETEKRRVNLISTHNKSHVIGCKDDFLLNTCSFLDNATAILDYDFLDIMDVISPPRCVITIDELPPTVPEETETASSREPCFDPNRLEDKLVRDLEARFCGTIVDDGVMDENMKLDDKIDFDDEYFDDKMEIDENQISRLTGVVEKAREGSSMPSTMGNYDIQEVSTDIQFSSVRRALGDIQNEPSFAIKSDCKVNRSMVNLEAIAGQIKENVDRGDAECFSQIKCRSFKDAYVEDNYLNDGEGKRNKHLMVPVVMQEKYLDFNKMKKEREKNIKKSLEKRGDNRISLSYGEIVEYFRVNAKGKFCNASVESTVYDKDKLYDACLSEQREIVRLSRRKVLKECEKSMNAATNMPETVVECMDVPVVPGLADGNIKDDYSDTENGIPTMDDHDLGTLPIVNEDLFTEEDFDLVRAPEIENVNTSMNSSRKRDPVNSEHELESDRQDLPSSQAEGSSHNRSGRSRYLEAYLNDTIIIQADEELPHLTYSEIIEKYNDQYWKNINREVEESYREVLEWDDFLKPHIKVEEERKNFDINEYGYDVIDKFNSVKQSVSFSEIVKSCPRHMISRYFLSTLLLVNKGNLRISQGGGINSISFELLKSDIDEI
uniref:Kleisin, abnormal closure, protein 2 (inferred by orthology to a C. elegans protein) n=1 Tax=Strongyloides venezuelensis TaxID=75913 RepID=A0A0K0FZM1_STRVS